MGRTVLGAFRCRSRSCRSGSRATQRAVAAAIAACGVRGPLTLRQDKAGLAFVTDGGHFILDAALQADRRSALACRRLTAIPGVVEHGLFIGLAYAAVIAGPAGPAHRRAPVNEQKGSTHERRILFRLALAAVFVLSWRRRCAQRSSPTARRDRDRAANWSRLKGGSNDVRSGDRQHGRADQGCARCKPIRSSPRISTTSRPSSRTEFAARKRRADERGRKLLRRPFQRSGAQGRVGVLQVAARQEDARRQEPQVLDQTFNYIQQWAPTHSPKK